MDSDVTEIPALFAEDRPHAPIIYFEMAPVAGHLNGIVTITLCAELQLPHASGPGITRQKVVVAHLRTTPQGASFLRDSLSNVDFLQQPAASATKN